MKMRELLAQIREYGSFWVSRPELIGAVDEVLARPVGEHPGEPVAYLRASDLEKLAQLHVRGCAASLEKTACEGFVGIYTHPAPADPGEVEQLRADLAETQRISKEEELRANRYSQQLAERDALLRELVDSEDLTFWPSAVERDHPSGLDLEDWSERARAALSATTEPSAPVEIDERAAFEEAFPDLTRNEDDSLLYVEDRNKWYGWQARAALPCEPSTDKDARRYRWIKAHKISGSIAVPGGWIDASDDWDSEIDREMERKP